MRFMVRRLLTPRWLAVHLLAVALIVAFGWLGHWQLDRAAEFRQSANDTSEPAPAPLASLTQVQGSVRAAAIGRLVTVSGTYDATHSYLVPGRPQGGRSGFWALSVLRLPAGPGVLVVRGWVPSVETAAETTPTSGPVEVTGRLMVSEDPSGGLPPGTALPAGQVAAANPVDLLSLVPYPLYDGYVTLRSQVPSASASLALVPSPRTGNDVPGFYFQHVAYVALWWLFAAFVVFFWFRLVRDAGGPPDEPARSEG
jgi:cytochrome oxidase assembly protein ShyY1